MDNQDGTGQHIWLRYTMQYSKDGHTHTIEMGISVPLGASTETREQLLREADTGMSQLIQHVEQRVSQALGQVENSHVTSNQGIAATASQTTPSPNVTKTESTPAPIPPKQSTPDQSVPAQARPANKPTSIPAPEPTTRVPNLQRTSSRTAPPAAQPINVPPTRHSVGASMPSSLGPAGTGGILTIGEFVSYVGTNWQLTPKQAMELLQVKSLSGINLREALERLQRIVAQNASGGTSIAQQPQQQGPQMSIVRDPLPIVTPPVSSNTPAAPLPAQPSQSTAIQRQDTDLDELPTRPTDEALKEPEQVYESNVIELRVARPALPAVGFDEETDENEELEDLEDFDNLSLSTEISAERLTRARDQINALREMQGAAVASAARLRVLRNAADEEVTTQQLEELVSGVWRIPSLQKLKVDQVEALISWAKQDYFLEEVEAVLVVLEEERYARGNR